MKAARTDGHGEGFEDNDPIHVVARLVGPGTDLATRERGVRLGLLAMDLTGSFRRKAHARRDLVEGWLLGDAQKRAELEPQMRDVIRSDTDAPALLCGVALTAAEPGRVVGGAVADVVRESGYGVHFLPTFCNAVKAADEASQ